MVLILLAIPVAALLILAAVSRIAPASVVTVGSIGASGAVAMLAAAKLVAGGGISMVGLPAGFAGAAVHLALDPLGGSFLLLLFLVTPCADRAPLPLAGLALTVLAGDGITLGVGLLLLGGTVSLRQAAFVVVCLVASLALAGSLTDYTAIRTVPPEGWRAAAMWLLVLAGVAAVVRFSPTIALYLMLRLLFDLGGVGQPVWWGVPLVLGGAGIAATGALRAALADTLQDALRLGPLGQFGLAAIAVGVALFARAVDLPAVTARALAASWLALVCHLVGRTLLLVCADAVERGAATRQLRLIGGLIHRMPVTAACCLAGLLTMAMLPPGLGFAAFWLLFQSLIAIARIGGPGLQLLVLAAAAVAALCAALHALAAVRLFGVVFLGRPRGPRVAVAEEVQRPVRLVLIGLAGVLALFGLLPALALLPAAGWIGAASQQWLALGTGAEAAGYSPIVVAALLVVVTFLVLRGLTRPGEQRREPAWSGGFAAPDWLPFGDPATQSGPDSFAEPVRRGLAPLPSAANLRGRLLDLRAAAVRAAAARGT